MKIAIFGADGRTGRYVVKEALSRGHIVTGSSRNTSDVNSNKQLTYIACDVLDAKSVEKVIYGCDVVVSVIGHVKNSPEFVQSEGITNIINSMEKLGVRRLISLTGTGVRFPGDKITLVDRFLNLSIGIIDPKRIADGKKHVEILKESMLDWTIIRVLKLQNTKPSEFILRENGPTKNYVSRQDVAKAILDVLEGKSYVREAPILSKVHR
jgi:putative NADH-flavin reductase